MLYIVVAVAVGLAMGWARGGRLSGIGDATFRLTPLLAVGVAGQVLSAALGGARGLALLLASYIALLAFAIANAPRSVGMAVVAVGIAMNALVIAVNGGMPVRASAIIAAGIADDDDDIAELDFGTKRHLEDGDDRLTILADIIPVPVLEEVLSFGDLVLAVGVADVLVTLMGSRRSPRQRPERPDRQGTG